MDAIDEVLSRDIMEIGRNMRTIEMGKQIAILEHNLVEQTKQKKKLSQNLQQLERLPKN